MSQPSPQVPGIDPKIQALFEACYKAEEENRFADADALTDQIMACVVAQAPNQLTPEMLTPEIQRELLAAEAENAASGTAQSAFIENFWRRR